MNVLIITEDEVFYLVEFFERFLAHATGAPYSLTAIAVSPAFNKRSPVALARQMLDFYGGPQFVRVAIRYAARKALRRTVAGLAAAHGTDIWRPSDVNAQAFVQRVKDTKTDVIVSVAAPQVFKKELIGSAPKGCINSHTSLLPENRGMMPVFWGMLKGEREIGVTIHYINERLDSGDIIKQVRVPIANESLHEMMLETKRLSALLMHDTLCEISAGTVSRRPMPMGGSYQSFPTRADVKEFRRRGHRLF